MPSHNVSSLIKFGFKFFQSKKKSDEIELAHQWFRSSLYPVKGKALIVESSTQSDVLCCFKAQGREQKHPIFLETLFYEFI